MRVAILLCGCEMQSCACWQEGNGLVPILKNRKNVLLVRLAMTRRLYERERGRAALGLSGELLNTANQTPFKLK
jgi:hypothetical protein